MNKTKLEIIYGPMFSGKSTEIIKRIRELKNEESSIIVIKPEVDDRYEKFYVCSHNKEKEECTIINNNDIFSLCKKIKYQQADYVIIDEAQFIRNLKDFIVQELEYKSFIIGGLDLDSFKKPFGDILNLIELADRSVKLQSICSICGDKAPYTKRISNNDNKILIGSNEYYTPVCSKHFENDEKIHYSIN